MKEKGIDVYVIPSSDYHQSEYVGEYFKTREFISGFTGSAGTVVVTENEAGLWTDGRYFIQAEKQLEGSSITLFKMGEENVPTFIEYISKNLKSGQCLGFDGKVLSVKNVFDIKNGFGKKEIKLEDRYDLVNEIWNDRPALPKSNVFILDEKYCGESFESKIKRIREKMSKLDANRHILTSLDDIAWLYNIRGRDIKNNPVSLAYTMISAEEVVLYIDKNKINLRTKELMKMINLDYATFSERYPLELSGGQQQRVGVARAFALDPGIILMDEPFSAVDPISRKQLQDELIDIQKKLGKTIIFVTHDIQEAIKIADKICLMNNGEIMQYDTPENIIKNPKNDFVRKFING